jgi:hypothetical protein
LDRLPVRLKEPDGQERSRGRRRRRRRRRRGKGGRGGQHGGYDDNNDNNYNIISSQPLKLKIRVHEICSK